MFGFRWKCRTCGQKHDDIPTCFGIEAPWRAFVSEQEFEQRVELTKSLCVVDGEHFFIRGHVEIPIIGHHENLAFSVWSSLSEESFVDVNEHWDDPNRAACPPYFGWLSSPITPYGNVINLPLSVQSRKPDMVPLFTIRQAEHPLAIDQRDGIAIRRWHEIALAVMR
ncbi:MAG: DUF2199 domain-containing protein [Asticcacaulis sp.]|uniref:DUF2199 domain-containing protein n=1 Tax=Asticcacaulis sp. TaxID=1872648 RepID=UPI0039E3C77E